MVESIDPIRADDATATAQDRRDPQTNTTGAMARLNLKLDKAVGPLPKDSIFRVRYRSSFGLKYLEIIRGEGDAPEGFAFDGTDDSGSCALPVDATLLRSIRERPDGCFQTQTEFDDIANTFDTRRGRPCAPTSMGFGDAFAGRGTSLNDAIASLQPLFRGLRPVTKVLTEPATRFRRFFPALGERRPDRRPGRRAAGRRVHQGGDHVRGDLSADSAPCRRRSPRRRRRSRPGSSCCRASARS